LLAGGSVCLLDIGVFGAEFFQFFLVKPDFLEGLKNFIDATERFID
jgi:hypothetical protein